MKLEEVLTDMMIKKSGSVKSFCEASGLKYTTALSILKRGVLTANIDHIILMCNALEISVDALAEGRIEEKKKRPAEENDLAIILERICQRAQTDTGLLFDGEPISRFEVGTTKKSIEFMLEVMRGGRDARRYAAYTDAILNGKKDET